jgi:hypothetical protein
LTGRSVDGLTGEHLEEFREAYEEFMDIFEEEEKLFPPINNIYSYRTTIMKVLVFSCLRQPEGLI